MKQTFWTNFRPKRGVDLYRGHRKSFCYRLCNATLLSMSKQPVCCIWITRCHATVAYKKSSKITFN